VASAAGDGPDCVDAGGQGELSGVQPNKQVRVVCMGDAIDKFVSIDERDAVPMVMVMGWVLILGGCAVALARGIKRIARESR